MAHDPPAHLSQLVSLCDAATAVAVVVDLFICLFICPLRIMRLRKGIIVVSKGVRQAACSNPVLRLLDQ